MLGMLFYYEVPQMAWQKNKAARFRALIALFRQEVKEGEEEGITGRELEKWWEVQLKALLRHKWRDPTLVESEMSAETLFMEKMVADKEEVRARGLVPPEAEEEEADGDGLRRKGWRPRGC